MIRRPIRRLVTNWVPLAMASYDFAVVGGGLVGGALAYGLARLGEQVVLIDEGDVALRASRGNFGLVWVQGKGLNKPEYTALSLKSADMWGDFARELREVSGVDVEHSRRGGALIASSETELDEFANLLKTIKDQNAPAGFDFQVLDNAGLAKLLPGLGSEIPGGTYTPYDGHVNPLKFLKALHAGFIGHGGIYRPNSGVEKISSIGNEFDIQTKSGGISAGKVIVAAGLSTTKIAADVGLRAPVSPLHGQLLITERVPQFLSLPTNIVRQTDEGTIQVGYSKEDLGLSTETRPEFLRDIAHNAVRAFPCLEKLRVVRTWGALRIMTPDGFPIYDQSATHPGAFAFTCHSGVTLGALHALVCASWIRDGSIPSQYQSFSAERFHVQAA